jgi:arsenite methyltransferase
MTDAQLRKAETLRRSGHWAQVRFVEGHIESLPVPAESVDFVISNGVINLSADKPAVFREAARVLRPGGRLVVADIVTGVQLPAATIACSQIQSRS